MKRWISLVSAMALTLVMCLGLGFALPVSEVRAEDLPANTMVVDLSKVTDDTRYLLNTLEGDFTDKSVRWEFDYYYDVPVGTDWIGCHIRMAGLSNGTWTPQLNTVREQKHFTLNYTSTGNATLRMCIGGNTDASYSRMLQNIPGGKLYISNMSLIVTTDETSVNYFSNAYTASTTNGDWGASGWAIGGRNKSVTDIEGLVTFINDESIHYHSFTTMEHDATDHWYACSECGTADTKTAHTFDKEYATAAALKSGTLGAADAVYYKSCMCGAVSTSDDDTFLPHAIMIDLSKTTDAQYLFNSPTNEAFLNTSVTFSFDYYYDVPEGTDWIGCHIRQAGYSNGQWSNGLNKIRTVGHVSFTYANTTNQTLRFCIGAGTDASYSRQLPVVEGGKLYLWNLSATVAGDDTNYLEVTDNLYKSASAYNKGGSDGWSIANGNAPTSAVSGMVNFINQADVHIHNFNQYAHDDTTHWAACSCGLSSGNKEAHNFCRTVISTEALKTPATATESAVYYRTCSCGAIAKEGDECITSTEVSTGEWGTNLYYGVNADNSISYGTGGGDNFARTTSYVPVEENTTYNYTGTVGSNLACNIFLSNGQVIGYLQGDHGDYTTGEFTTPAGTTHMVFTNINHAAGQAKLYKISNEAAVFSGSTINQCMTKLPDENTTLSCTQAGVLNMLVSGQDSQGNVASYQGLRFYETLVTHTEDGGVTETVTVGENTYTVKGIYVLVSTSAWLQQLGKTADDLTVDLYDNEHVKATKITKVRSLDYDANTGTVTYSFTALLTNVAQNMRSRMTCARAYLSCVDADGNTHCVYGNVQTTSVLEMYNATKDNVSYSQDVVTWMEGALA